LAELRHVRSAGQTLRSTLLGEEGPSVRRTAVGDAPGVDRPMESERRLMAKS